MNIAIDITPLNDTRILSHRVRGTGFYLRNLKNALLTYFPEHDYCFFDDKKKVDDRSQLVHYPYFEPFFITLPFSEKFKTVVTVHDLTPLVFPKHFPSGIRGKVKWRMQKKRLQKAERIITDSLSSKKDIFRFTDIPEENIDVVYLAASEEFKKMADEKGKVETKKKYGLAEKFVLYVGDATWNKNLPRLINACLKMRLPLVMVGKTLTQRNFDKTNPWNQDLVKTQQLIAANPKIKALGYLPTEDLAAIYNLATAFAMPSLYEGFGLPVIEAMQSGCPVITTREGSLPEVAGDAAFYAGAKDEEDISEKINEVFENTKLQKELSEKGLRQAKKFSWEKTAEKTIESYKKVLGHD